MEAKKAKTVTKIKIGKMDVPWTAQEIEELIATEEARAQGSQQDAWQVEAVLDFTHELKNVAATKR